MKNSKHSRRVAADFG